MKLPSIYGVVGCAALLLFARLATAAEQPKLPNIVLIVSDDHAWNDYGFMGHKQVQTPHLDKLAGQSLTFKRGYVPSSLCCPSLVTMITGLYPHQHKITSNDPPLPAALKTAGMKPGAARKDPAYTASRAKMIGFVDDVPTLPKLLQQQGYQSLQTGKWWQGHFQRGGFTHGMTTGETSAGGRHGDKGLDIGRVTLQPIYDFIDSATEQQKPFFVWYAPMLPHTPHTAPERILAKYRPLTESLPQAKYWASVEWFDETCGQLLAQLDQRKLSDNTIVVYLSDNGWIQQLNANNYAPKSKQSQYDGGVRTPIMIRWPGHITPKFSDELAISTDIAPTLLTAVGLKPTANMSGLNLLDANAVSQRKAIFGECFTHDAVQLDDPASSLRWRWMISGNTKLIVPAVQNEPAAVVELYDLAADPHETQNLAPQQPQKVAEMQAQLDSWWNGKVAGQQ